MKQGQTDKGTYTYEKRDPDTGAWVGEKPVAYDAKTGTKVFQVMMERFDRDSGDRRILERSADKFGKVRPRVVADSTEMLPAAPALCIEPDGNIIFAAW